MKRFCRNTLLAVSFSVLALAGFGQYCLPNYQVGSCVTGDYIQGVLFNTINNQNAVCPPVNPNNTDYSSSFCTSVCPGSSYQITITNNPNNGEYMAVCIDLDGNGDFAGPGEFFPVGYAPPGAVISANIAIPSTATPGNSKLRVFCQNGLVPLGQSDVCGNLGAGEVQDYCLTINPGVTVNLGGNISQCGGTVNLNAANAGATYSWSDGSNTQVLPVATSGNYAVTVTNSNTCSASASTNVYIKPVPVVALGNDIVQCGGPVTLNAGNTGAVYEWSTGEVTQTIVVDTTGNFGVSVTNSSGCTANGSLNVTIDTIPVVSLASFAPQCGGHDTLDAGNVGAAYLWSDGSTDQTLIASASAIYRVTVTTGNNCTATASENITIHPLPPVTITIQSNVCNTIPVFNLYGGAPTGGKYYVDHVADTSFYNTVDAGIAGHNITYIYSDTFGCVDSAVTYITVRQHPFITTLDPPVMCAGSGTIDLDDYFNPRGGVYSGLGVSTHYFYPPLSGPGQDTVIDIVTDSYGCVDTSIYPIHVGPAVKVSLTPSVLDNSICAGQSVTFNAYGALNYQFFIDTTAQGPPSSNGTFTTFALKNGDMITVVGTNACSTDTSLPVGFDVHPLPMVSAGTDTTISLGQSVQLNGSANGSGLMVYQWSPAELLNIGNIPDPVYSGQADSVTFTLVASDTYGCIDSNHVTVHVSVPDAIVLPNIITPDGNGKNDTWKVNSRVDLSGSRLVIVNRWGETVYEADSYNNNWGGTYKNTSEKLPDGTYYYELKVPSQNNHLYKGAINILNGGANK